MSFELEPSLASSHSVGSHSTRPGEDPLPLGVVAGPQQQRELFKGWPHTGELVVLALGSRWQLVHGPWPGRRLLAGIWPWDGWWAWEVESSGLWEVLSTLSVQTTIQRGQKPTGCPPPCLANIHIHRSFSIKWWGYNNLKHCQIKIKVGNQKAWLQSLPIQHGRTKCEFQMVLGHLQLQVWVRGRHGSPLLDPFPPVPVIFVFLLTLIMHHHYVEESECGRWPSPVPPRPNSEPLHPSICFLFPLLRSGPW